MAERSEAQEKRAKSRAERRGTQAGGGQPQVNADGKELSALDLLSDAKGAVGAAAVGAALGTVVGAARALKEMGEGEHHNRRDTETPDPRPAAHAEGENESPEAEDDHETVTETPSPQLNEGAEQEVSDPTRKESEPAGPPAASTDEAATIIRTARQQLKALQGHDAETVSALERTHEGWLVTLEVVEVARVPETTDVLASYEMAFDEDGNLRRYARTRRYRRSQADREEP